MDSFANDLQKQHFDELVSILTTPIDELGKYLSEDEQEHYRQCQKSIIESAHWTRPFHG